ncbi:MAG: RNA 2',3'-cyclic phosphodiesterase [Elusimicrobiota bacterium]
MRCFIALSLSTELKKKALALQEELKKSQADLKWVEEENFHLTLKFFADCPEETVVKLKSLIRQVGREFAQFEVELYGLAAAPDLFSPKVLWIPVRKGGEMIKDIFEFLENHLLLLGFPREKRPFLSHLTLGRVRSSSHLDDLKQKIKSLNEIHLGKEVISSIQLVRSILTKSGPVYSVISEAKLKLGDVA